MNTFLILFLISLISLSVILIRKVMMLRRGILVYGEQFDLNTPYIEELKSITIKKAKKYGYVILIATFRLSMRTSKFVKNKSSDVLLKVKKLIIKDKDGQMPEQEVSKFLKMITDYKRKINRIKNKVKREEGLE